MFYNEQKERDGQIQFPNLDIKEETVIVPFNIKAEQYFIDKYKLGGYDCFNVHLVL